MKSLRKYNVGLDMEGHVNFVIETVAPNFRTAALEWARVTGHTGDLLNEEKLTYFNMKIVKTKLPALQRKENFNPFIR